MIYFVFLIILTVISGLLYKHKVISKRAASIIISIYAIFIYSIRGENVGNVDIPRYIDSYESLKYLSFSDLPLRFNRDIVFYYFSKLLSILSSNYNFWFAIIGTVFISSVSQLIIRFSNRLILSYLIFFTFSFALNFSLLRHCCAFALVIHGYISLKDDKLKKAILFFSIASLFHFSAIIAFIMVLLRKIKFGKWNLFLIIATIMITILVPNILGIIVGVLNMDRFNHYGENEIMTLTNTAMYINLAFLLLIYILILFKGKRYKEKHSFELNIFTVGVFLYGLVGVLAEFYRTAMFFSFVLIVLLPNVLDEFNYTKDKNIINVGVFVFSILLLIYFFTIVLYSGQLIPFETNL